MIDKEIVIDVSPILDAEVCQILENTVHIILRQIFGADGWRIIDCVRDGDYFVARMDVPKPFSTKDLLLLGRCGFIVTFNDGYFTWKINNPRYCENYIINALEKAYVEEMIRCLK